MCRRTRGSLLRDLDAPVKYAPCLEVREGNARYQRG